MAALKALKPLAGGNVTEDRPPLALGGAPLGNLFTPVSEQDARATIDAAWDEGIRSFDVAPLYGHGAAERRLGAALARHPRDEFVISTKVGRLIRSAGSSDAHPTSAGWSIKPGTQAVFDFSYEGVMRSVDESLERLGMDRIDLLFIHDPDDHYIEASTTAYRALDSLRSQQVVRAIGVGVTNPELLKTFAESNTGIYNYFLSPSRYTLLNQDAEELLSISVSKGIGVLAGGTFNSGVLANPSPSATYDYQPVSADILLRAVRMQQLCARFTTPLPAAAMQFPARHPAVSSVVVGARTAQEVRVNAKLYRTSIPDQLWSALAEGQYGVKRLSEER